jgi:hypothetical protein
MRLDVPTSFRNRTGQTARYIVIVTTLNDASARR